MGLGSIISSYQAGKEQGRDTVSRAQLQKQLTEQKMREEDRATKLNNAQVSQADETIKKLQQQIKLQDMKMQEFQDVRDREDLYRAFDSGNSADITRAIQSSPYLQETFGGVNKIEKFDGADKDFSHIGINSPVWVLHKDSQGNIVKSLGDLDQLKALSGYTRIVKEREQAEKTSSLALEQSKATLASTKAKTAKTNAEIDKLNQPTVPKASELVNMQKFNKNESEASINDYVTNNYSQFSKDLSTKDISEPIELPNGKKVSLLKIAEMRQGDEKLPTTERALLTGLYDANKSFVDLKAELSNPKLEWDGISKAMSEMAKLVPEDYLNMSSEQKSKLIERFSFNAKLRTAMASYIKAMSGAAVSDNERDFYTTTIVNGNWSNKISAQASLNGFITGLGRAYNNRIESIKDSYPKDYLYERNKLHADKPKRVLSVDEISSYQNKYRIN